ncbi:HAD-IIIA family hydrolase [Candidatus Woesearchaeota archaeon]|nr:HAD-IIIA family hydrolase [Candidatus Woesearchaeota archaeon]
MSCIKMQAVILAGGKGVRLRPLTYDLPKPLVKVGDKPILEHILLLLKKQGVTNIIICSGYLGQHIIDFCGDGSKFGLKITHSIEKSPLGTAGPLKDIEDSLEEDFFVIYGDIYLDMDLNKLMAYHKSKKSKATLVVHPSDHPHDSDVVVMDQGTQKIKDFLHKPGKEIKFQNLTSAAAYALNKSILSYISSGEPTDFGKDIFPKMAADEEPMFGYITDEFIKDAGTHDRLAYVSDYIHSDNKNQAWFLDRDGVINEEAGLITESSQLKLIPGSAEAIKKLNDRGFLVVIVTNQPQVARNLCTEEDVEKINARLVKEFEKEGARIDGVYYCPHHPETNHPDANDPKYRRPCECRKPGIGMLKQAEKEFKIDLKRSYMVGDRTADIKAGNSAGCTTIIVRTGFAGKDGKYEAVPDIEAEDLIEAVDKVLKRNKI